MKQPEDFDQPDEMSEQGESFVELEEYLTLALQRVDAPKGFAERTMARTRPAPAEAKILLMPSRLRVWTSGAIAAALLAGVFVGDQVHARRQRERAEEAQRQFEVGMRITDAALERTRQQLRRVGVVVD